MMTDEVSRSLLRPVNQKPTICYCKPDECSAPKPEWCIGRRYADGFREPDAQEREMNDKERERDKQLIANLEKETSEQADELERLAALVQSNAEPVALRPLGPDGKPLPGWYYDEDSVCRPYRPGASAGLIEAAEYLKCFANDYMNNWIHDGEVAETLLKASEHLRARAADRSGK